MSDKTDIQALTEQIQLLNANMQQLSKDMQEIKSTGVAANTTQVIRPSDFSAKVGIISCSVLSFVFTFFIFGWAVQICSYIVSAGIFTNPYFFIPIAAVLACIASFYITRYWYKNLAKKPIVNIENLRATI